MTTETPWWKRNLIWHKEPAEPSATEPWHCSDESTKRVLALLYKYGGVWHLFFEDAGYGSMPSSSSWTDPDAAIQYVSGVYRNVERRDRMSAEGVRPVLDDDYRENLERCEAYNRSHGTNTVTR